MKKKLDPQVKASAANWAMTLRDGQAEVTVTGLRPLRFSQRAAPAAIRKPAPAPIAMLAENRPDGYRGWVEPPNVRFGARVTGWVGCAGEP
jgi:hypothetical protein